MPTPAQSLEGLILPGEWTVVRHIPKGSGTGGNFSESYEVEHSSGRRAFLKALDFNRAHSSADPVGELKRLTSKYDFERAVLCRCRDLRLRNVCTSIADGLADVGPMHAPLQNVPYIIFDLARGNIRRLCSARFDAVLSLRSLHAVAVGLNQLHLNHIVHQDVKPSNVLHYSNARYQVADLGEAVDQLTPSPNDAIIQPGDPSYWPPELQYGYLAGGDFDRRKLVDLYLLGSLFFFFFSNSSAIHSLHHVLRTYGLPPNRFSGTLHSDMPYFERAFSDSLAQFSADVRSKIPELEAEITELVRELCYPDPNIRGDRHRRSPMRHNLQRYISRINTMVKKAELLA